MVNPKIIIVEDETIIGLDIKLKLERKGYSGIEVISTGEKAIELSKQQLPDIVLMDIKLAGNLDGIQTATQLKALGDPPIIFLSAFSDNAIMDKAKALNPAGYLTKAAADDKLIAIVETELEKKR